MTKEICDYCGEKYDSDSEGHDHFEDGSCECKYCIKSDGLRGKKFCSPECEYHYITENFSQLSPLRN